MRGFLARQANPISMGGGGHDIAGELVVNRGTPSLVCQHNQDADLTSDPLMDHNTEGSRG